MVCALLSISSQCMLPSSKTEQILGSKYSLNPVSETLKRQLYHEFNSPFGLKQLHALAIKINTALSVIPLSRVASICALTPSFLYAQQFFEQLDDVEQIFIWNCCLKEFAESESPFDAVLLFYQLRAHDICPDSFTCSFVLKACVKLVDLSQGRIIHTFIEKLGLQSNLVLQNEILHLYASCGLMSDALLLFNTMRKRDIVTWNTMITQLVKRGDIDLAYEMFLKMPERNVRSWTAMISGLVQCGKPKEAIRVFAEMEESDVKPNEVTIVAVLAACADLVTIDLGIRIHRYADKSGFKKNIHVCNTLIDMYIKCGCIKSARDVFEDMKDRTIFSWSSMIQGLAIHGQAEEALELFSRMIRTGIEPNGITFIGLLQACSHMGLINEGRTFFTSMAKDYKISPSIEHYGCMVDLLSRAGMLQEAHDFIKGMPMKPNAAIWGALLGGCKVHKNVEMAEVAMRHLNELDPSNDGYYVVLSNIYSEAKQWENAANVRKLMRNRGLKKTPGWSSVTVNGVLHEFVSGDDTHPQTDEIFQIWNHLLERMKLKGYVPNTSVILLDMEEKEKEKFLFRHSEKLALVFGLMNTSAGETIRIFKNLRICEDCHASFKLISEIADQEIIVRDRNRFHCFKDGSCSCRDYW